MRYQGFSLCASLATLVQAMASTKGHPFWKAVIDGMMERAYIFDVGANYAPVKEGDWETNILWRVGEPFTRPGSVSVTAHVCRAVCVSGKHVTYLLPSSAAVEKPSTFLGAWLGLWHPCMWLCNCLYLIVQAVVSCLHQGDHNSSISCTEPPCLSEHQHAQDNVQRSKNRFSALL